MVVKLLSDKIEVGMFVILPESLFENPFWKSQFIVKNEKQIQKIIKAGLKWVQVDFDKSQIESEVDKLSEPFNTTNEEVYGILFEEPDFLLIDNTVVIEENKYNKISTNKEFVHSTKWEPEKFMLEKFVEAIKNTNLAPVERAKVVHNYSIELMKNILENSTAANIMASKDGSAKIVDVIMNEDETCASLTEIVSHDFYTYTHSVNVGIKSILLAKAFYGESGI